MARRVLTLIRAVIFDLDGLLVDSEVYWEQARQTYCAELGCRWQEEDELAAKGKNSEEWAALISERCRPNQTSEEIIAGVTSEMRALYEQHLPLLPGAIGAVEVLHGLQPLGVASSSPLGLIKYVLYEAGIGEYFSVVVSSDDVGKGKPNPDVFLETARRLGVLPEEIVVFEDSSAGIGAAHAAGMHIIAVPNAHYPPNRDALAQSEIVLDSLTEFSPALLDQLSARQ